MLQYFEAETKLSHVLALVQMILLIGTKPLATKGLLEVTENRHSEQSNRIQLREGERFVYLCLEASLLSNSIYVKNGCHPFDAAMKTIANIKMLVPFRPYFTISVLIRSFALVFWFFPSGVPQASKITLYKSQFYYIFTNKTKVRKCRLSVERMEKAPQNKM